MSIADTLLSTAEHWKPLADWLTAIGTIGTVVVALWLALRASSTRLLISADLVFEFNAANAEPELWVACAAQNRGAAEVVIADYGFQLWP